MSLIRNFRRAILGPGHYAMDRDAPNGFKAEQVIYRKVALSAKWADYYIDRPVPVLVTPGPGWNIEDYVKDIALNGFKPIKQDYLEYAWLGISVRRHSYIIIELDENRTFDPDPKKLAIDLAEHVPDQRTTDDLFGELRYVDPAGQSWATPVPGCRIAYFSAVPRPVLGYEQRLNFNVISLVGVPSSIDPDVRYPGNGGNP